MSRYKVTAEHVVTYVVEVSADDEEAAEEAANEHLKHPANRNYCHDDSDVRLISVEEVRS